MSSQTPASKSQIRAAALLNISIDRSDYTATGAALEAAGVRADAIPAGLTWRSAGKLSDSELLSALGKSAATDSASQSLAARESGAATWAGFKRQVRLERRAAGQAERDYRDEETIDRDSAGFVARPLTEMPKGYE